MPPSDFLNYPEAVATAETPFALPTATNPVVSGLPLTILSNLVSYAPPLQQLLWSNAGFGNIRAFEATGALAAHPARFDPTVLPRNPPAAAESALAPTSPTTPNPDVFYSASDYINAYKSGTTTPTAVAETILELLASTPSLKATFISLLPRADFLAAAEASTARYAAGTPLPLDGVPLAVKDEFDVTGTPRTLGLSLAIAETHNLTNTTTTSLCVQRLLDAGMLCIGKTNMHELGLDTTNNNPHHGIPVNPYNADFYTGGSSGGSAAAVSSGLVPIAVGADGGGSIRLPSSYCGIFGLKPSHNLIPITPTPCIAPSVGVAGPMTAHLSDLATALHIMAATPPAAPSPTRKLLGIYEPWFDSASPAVQQHTRAAVDTYVSRGWEVVPITIPHLPLARTAHALTILTEISSALSQNSSGLSAANKLLFSVARQTPARDFVLAQRLRSLLMSHLAELWQRYPGMVVVSPVTPMVGVRKEKGAEGGVSDSDRSLSSMLYVFLANFCGCPAGTGTVGYDEETGMPVGLMGMAEWGEEGRVLEWLGEWEGRWEGRRRGEGWVDVLGMAKAK